VGEELPGGEDGRGGSIPVGDDGRIEIGIQNFDRGIDVFLLLFHLVGKRPRRLTILHGWSIWQTLGVGRPTVTSKIGCFPRHRIVIEWLESAALKHLHFAPQSFEN
jgi:hypothetical protein